MFNLIVKGSGWTLDRDTIVRSRVFEYTTESLAEQFKPAGTLDLPALALLPTIFLDESNGDQAQTGHVGRILNARIVGNDISIEYIREPNVPPIKNGALRSFADELGIEDFEFFRTHWAVKEADLFRSLYKNLQPHRNRPRVFRIADADIVDPSAMSVMMPFETGFDPVYKAIRGVAKKLRLRCQRADDIWEHPEVIQDVVSLIDRSGVVICDCSKRNPNVFYEIGIAHTLGREVILITQSEGDIPFDLRHLRYVPYLNNGEGLLDLASKLESKIEDLLG